MADHPVVIELTRAEVKSILEGIDRANAGIEAITRVLQEIHSESPPDWWSDHIQGGLQGAIEALTEVTTLRIADLRMNLRRGPDE